ncbi:MAG: protein phosphatase 2C domain-containing protein [Planctomycetaceae bacterium]
MTDPSLVDTEEFPVPLVRKMPSKSSLVEVDFGGVSDVGKVRSNNEDTFFVSRFDRTMQPILTNLPPAEAPDFSAETCYGMLVADGMGGHAAGEVASRTAVRVLIELVLQTPDWIMQFDEPLQQRVIRRFEQRLWDVQDALTQQARADAELFGMGTTMTIAVSVGANLLVVHLGDSRAYLLRNGALERLTRDQTIAQEMQEAGMLTAEQAAQHQLRHVLTGVLSAGGKKLPVEFRNLTLRDGDQILLCSDGLTEMISEEEIVAVLQRPGSAMETSQALVVHALEAGGKDNVTAVLARYHFP